MWLRRMPRWVQGDRLVCPACGRSGLGLTERAVELGCRWCGCQVRPCRRPGQVKWRAGYGVLYVAHHDGSVVVRRLELPVDEAFCREVEALASQPGVCRGRTHLTSFDRRSGDVRVVVGRVDLPEPCARPWVVAPAQGD